MFDELKNELNQDRQDALLREAEAELVDPVTEIEEELAECVSSLEGRWLSGIEYSISLMEDTELDDEIEEGLDDDDLLDGEGDIDLLDDSDLDIDDFNPNDVSPDDFDDDILGIAEELPDEEGPVYDDESIDEIADDLDSIEEV